MNKQIKFILLIFLAIIRLHPAPVEIFCSPDNITAYQGEKILLYLKVKNNLPESIRPGAGYSLSYHLYDQEGKLILFDNRRYIIPIILEKKSTTHFCLPVYFEYPISGQYIVEFDIVKEGQFWGASKNWQTDKVLLILKKLVSPEFKHKYLNTFYATRDTCLNQEQYLLRMILRNSEIVQNNRIVGFSPGTNYPQIWIRDTATFINLAKHHYPRKMLEANLELFLTHQQQNGEIPDWVNLSGKSDKNTVSTDQESSLVIAAFEIALDNPVWLKKRINGKSVYQRLEMALDWVWKYRRDPTLNLISSGLTADWGDVENSYPDQRATKLSHLSRKIFSIYTQSKYIQAMDKLIQIYHYLEKEQKVIKWKQRLTSVFSQTKKKLYLKDRGYFLIHLCPQSNRYVNLEKEILATGGNAEAMVAGLMNREQIRKFITVLERKRAKYQLPNVSFSLIPPYPAGFFPHPALKQPWIYQNGGQWDWIGGRLVKALFLKGFRKKAHQYLMEIIEKNLKNLTIFEWEDKNGNPLWGAKFYTGAAGVMGEAILKGYLGYSQNFNGYRFAPLNESYLLKINKTDRFVFSRKEKIMVHIKHMNNKSMYIFKQPGSPHVTLNQKGIHFIDLDNDRR
jgi:hypothetical protein